MKRILFKSVAFLLFAAAITACSSESSVDLSNDADANVPVRQGKSEVWSGIIGVDRGNDVYEITADKEAILTDLQNIVYKEGGSTLLETLDIVKKAALNDANDSGYMLIATDNRERSIGMMLVRNQMGHFQLGQPLTPVTTSCTGCATGCNLEYLNIDGKKVPICNENGCIADCKKTETELN